MKRATSSSTTASSHFASDDNPTKRLEDARSSAGQVAARVAPSRIKEGSMKSTFFRIGAMAATVLVIVLVLTPRQAQAAVVITTNTNWSAITTGTGGGQPTSADDVTVKNGATLTVDVSNGTCKSLTLGSSTAPAGNGTISFNSGSQVTDAGTVALGGSTGQTATIDMTNGGTLITDGFTVTGGAGTVTLTPGSGTIQLGTANTTLPAAFTTYNHLTITGSTIKLGVATTLNGNLTISGGTFDCNNFDLTVKGNWTNNSAAGTTFSAHSNTVTLSGSAAQTIGGSSVTTFNNLTINNASGVTNSVAGTTVNGTLTLTTGTLTLASGLTMATGSTISRANGSLSGTPTFAGTVNVTYTGATGATTTGSELPTSATALNNLTINDSGQTVTLNAAVNVNGTLVITAGTFDTSASNFAVTLNGGFTNSGTFTANASNITIGGTSTSVSIAGFSTTGALSFTRTANTATLTGGVTAASLTMNGTNGTLNLGAALSHQINGTVLITNGTLNASSSTLNLTGDWTKNGGTFTASTSTINFNGTTQTIGGSQATTFATLTVANGSTTTATINPTITTFNVNGGGKYIHNLVVALPGTTKSFASTSTIEYQNNSTNTCPATATYGNLIVNVSAYSTAVQCSGALTSIAGDFEVKNTNGQELRLVTTQTTAHSIGGNLIVDGGTLVLASGNSGAGTPVVTVSGDATISSGVLDFTTNAGTGTPTLTINGNFTQSGGTLRRTSSGTSTMNVKGNWTRSAGTFTNTGISVVFNGSAAQSIGGSVATAFSSLTINNSAGVTLDTSTDVGASVSTALTLTTDLTVTYPDVLSETGVTVANSSGPGDVVGDVKRTDVGATTQSFGNVNVQITNTSGTATTVEVFLDKGTAPTGFTGAVKRTYTITEASGTVSGAIVRLRYVDPGEINSNNESLLTLWRNSTGTWVNQGVTTRDTANNWDELTGVSGFSSWALADGSTSHAPTLVRLTGFTATQQDDGVQLEWKSGFEANNLGYNLYRYQDGQRTKVTPSLIAGSSLIRKHGRDLTSGFSYGWFDPQGTVGTQYELQAIDLNGQVQTFAPRYMAKSGPHGDSQKARATLVTEVAAASTTGPAPQNGWAKGMASAAAQKTGPASTSALTTQQAIAAQQAVKIRVNQTGWYRITQPQLAANGFDPSADARRLQLYVDGVEVPIRLSTDKAKLGPGDTLEFYGVGLDALTTDTHTYYLISGARNGLRIATSAVGNVKKNEILAPDFLYTVESKERLIYLPGLLNGDADNIFGQIVSSDPITQNLSLQNIDATSNAGAQLEVVIQGFTEVAHQIQVQLNGSYVGTINFSGGTHNSSTLPINGALLREGANVVTLTAAGGDSDISLVDVLRMTYAHSYRADNDSLSFSVGNRSAAVSGFSSAAIRVIDVTNPGAVQELAPKITNSGGSYGFTIPTSSTVQNLLAFVDNLARQPASMVKNQPSTWNASTNAADMVIVTHGNFRSSADTLAAARRAQGMKVSVVDVEDVYDEFSYGAHTPQAVKDFLAWSNTHWATTPKYALLFGDSSWDPRNYLGQGYNDYVPTKLVDTVEFETASDDWLADFDGDGIPEIAVGRLPARTTGDASTMVSKILNYDQERASGAPLRGAVLVSDNGFEDQTAQVQSYLSPLTTVQTLNRSAIGNDDTMRTDIVNALDQGPTIVNYFGHGSNGVWTSAGLLNQDNGSTLTNGNRTSLFVMMTCLNGYFHDAFIDSLAETVLKDPQGGAFAVWASSGATEPVGQAQMNTQLYRSLLGNQPMTLGDAVRQAKMATTDFDVRRTWILLGDPAMRLK